MMVHEFLLICWRPPRFSFTGPGSSRSFSWLWPGSLGCHDSIRSMPALAASSCSCGLHHVDDVQVCCNILKLLANCDTAAHSPRTSRCILWGAYARLWARAIGCRRLSERNHRLRIGLCRWPIDSSFPQRGFSTSICIYDWCPKGGYRWALSGTFR